MGVGLALPSPAPATKPWSCSMQTDDKLIQELMSKVSDQMVESLKTSIQAAVEKEISKSLSKALLEGEFYRRINDELQGGLKEIYKEISAAKRTNGGAAVVVEGNTDELFTEAADQLDEILRTTEQAAVEIMDIVEKLQEMQITLGAIVDGMNTGGVTKADRLKLEDINSALGQDLMNIMASLSFQDLTGQRIKRIITALKTVEKLVLDMVMSTGLKIKAREKAPEKALDELDAEAKETLSDLKGPQAGADQGAVDDLLSQLGL